MATTSATTSRAVPSTIATTGSVSGQTVIPTSDDTEDKFMKLLVAQMRNQDPLNPLDNAQVTSQLAQINTVRGIDEMNQSLRKLLQRSDVFNPAESGAMVGRRVWVSGDQLELKQEEGARGAFELKTSMKELEIEIADSTGQVVDRMTLSRLSPGMHTFDWNPSAEGQERAPGTYRMRIKDANGETLEGAQTFRAATVRSIINGDSGVSFDLGEAGKVTQDQVRGVL